MSNNRGDHHMGVVEEGVLEPIAKLPGSRVQTGTRAPGTAASGRPNFRQTWSSIAPSLEILSPEEILEQQMEDLEIEDFGSGSGTDFTDNEEEDQGDYNDNVEKSRETTSLFQILEPGVTKEGTQPGDDEWEKDSDYTAARQISLIERDAESEVDSEEERDIMKEIKSEITKKVKVEMKAELDAMKRKIEKESGVEDKEDDLKDVDPDLKVAILKMRKLDRILAKKERKEKEVKKQRILLQARLRREIEDLKPDGREDIKEVQVNTSKYLALTLPVTHNAGLRVTEAGEVEDPSPPGTPLFQTQVPYDGSEQSKQRPHGSGRDGQEEEDDNQSTTSSAATGTSTNTKGSRGSRKKRTKKGTDYIKRNIQLAADAGESVAMTDDEKKRIGDLLVDLDTVPEVSLEEDLQFLDNPYQITLSTGEGFHPSKEEMHRLEAIDRRLKALMPPQEYESIASTPATLTPVQPSPLFSRTAMRMEIDEPAEEALRENKEHRDLQHRLQDIELQLNSVTSLHSQHVGEGKLSTQQLDRLLDDCVKSLSSEVTMDTSIQNSNRSSVVSSRLSLLEHPPHLPSHVLHQLLTEAGADISSTDRDPPQSGRSESETGGMRAITNGDRATVDSNTLSTDRQNGREIQNYADISSVTGDTPEVPNITQLRQNPGIYKQRDPANEWSQSRPSTGMSSVSPPSTADSSSSKREPFLPAINPRGGLSTRYTNNLPNGLSQQRMGSRPKVNSVWGSVDSDTTGTKSSRTNGFHSDSMATLGDSHIMPRPPSSAGSSRTVSRKGSGKGFSVQDIE